MSEVYLICIELAPLCPFEEILGAHLEHVTHFGRVTRCYSVTSLSALAYLRAVLAYFSGQTFAGASRGLF
jgi:hypothetical protein